MIWFRTDAMTFIYYEEARVREKRKPGLILVYNK
jgi:hypothetical protein